MRVPDVVKGSSENLGAYLKLCSEDSFHSGSVCWILEDACATRMNDYDVVAKISIVPRGPAGGVTIFTPSEDRLDSGLYTKARLPDVRFSEFEVEEELPLASTSD